MEKLFFNKRKGNHIWGNCESKLTILRVNSIWKKVIILTGVYTENNFS